MKIKNDTLYTTKTDLDHILAEFEGIGKFEVPPSELFLKCLVKEMEFNGMEDEIGTFDNIKIVNIWG